MAAKPDQDPRALALALLDGVLQVRRPLSELEAVPPAADAAPAVRARAGRLARATLRHLDRADATLAPHLARAPRPAIRALLRLATVEMLSEGAAPHGVVHSAVAQARRIQPKAAGMVNAVLRKVADTPRERWDALPPQRLPNWLRGRLGGAWGNARTAAMEALFAAPPPLDLTLRDPRTAGEWAARLEADVLPTGSLRRAAAGQVSALPGFAEGAWWVQDAAAALPARLLAPRPGERVLDLCAAPGGKTLQLAAAGARVTALDISGPRLERLAANLARTGLAAEIVAADALHWEPEAPFDAILLDAPCSATGTLRRHPDLPHVRDAAALKPLVALQDALIDRAAGWLAPGGRLGVCTCSLLPEEGEARRAAALERHPGLAADAAATESVEGLEAGWDAGPGALRITPESWAARGGIDGFHIAAFRAET
jgi:16S rRNA (cytosine967-C5)-methyltransferase